MDLKLSVHEKHVRRRIPGSVVVCALNRNISGRERLYELQQKCDISLSLSFWHVIASWIASANGEESKAKFNDK